MLVVAGRPTTLDERLHGQHRAALAIVRDAYPGLATDRWDDVDAGPTATTLTERISAAGRVTPTS